VSTGAWKRNESWFTLLSQEAIINPHIGSAEVTLDLTVKAQFVHFDDKARSCSSLKEAKSYLSFSDA